MGIPIGKLALYTAAGGVAPHRVLPITLDVGTNNERLLNDVDYVGIRQPRVQGAMYYHFLDEFMEAVTSRWPNVTVQFEDFETTKAIPLLSRYRTRYRCFNDDIQGTGAVTLAGLYAASRQAGDIPITGHRILCVGAGAGGLGVSKQILSAFIEAGLEQEEARQRFLMCSSKGAIGSQDNRFGNPHQNPGMSEEKLSWLNRNVSDGTPIEAAIEIFKPTVMLGLTGKPGTFTKSIVSAMAKNCPRPIIMPMSNPTCNSECTAEQAYDWSDGRAIVATGSPFPPYNFPDGRIMHPSQCNNVYIFPGLGLACSIGGMKTIPDKLFIAAAIACSKSLKEEEIQAGCCFPRLNRIRQVSHAVAVGVLKEALKEGLVKNFKWCDIADEGLESYVDRKMYFPYYVPLL